MSRGRRNSGSSVADCVHTAIFQNIRENRAPRTEMRTKIQGEVPTGISDLHASTTKRNR